MIIGWPQIIYILLTGIDLGIVAVKHGEPQKLHNFWTTLIATIIMTFIFWWGGFFG